MIFGRPRVAIIGAGISGLAAAHRLHELDPGLELSVLESSDRVGGVIRSEHFQGFCIEHGPDSLVTTVPWGLDLCRRVGIADELVGTSSAPNGVYLMCRGRLRRLPDGLALMAPRRLWPVMASPILSIRGKLRLACEYFIPPRQTSSDESLASFATRRLGREAFERLVQPLVSGIYMGSPDCLSARATFPKFVEMEAKHGSLIRAMRKQPSNVRAKLAGPTDPQAAKAGGGGAQGIFVAPLGGMEQLPTAIAARLPADTIQFNCRVRELSRSSGGRWRVVADQDGHASWTEDFDAVIIGTSAPAAARLLHDTVPSLTAELGAIDHGSCVVVNLAFRRSDIKHPLDAHGLVVPLVERLAVSACTFSSLKYPGRAPQDTCLLRAFLGGAASPQSLDWPDGQIKQTVLEELSGPLGIRVAPLWAKVARSRRVMPQYELGHLERVERIGQVIEHVPGLALAGNAYHGVGIAHCIRGGELAAGRIHQQLSAQQLSHAGT